MSHDSRLLALIAASVLFSAVFSAGMVSADCSVGDTRAIVLDWEPFNPFWDEDATDSVLAALEYWGIRAEDDEVFFRRQPEITNHPEILLSDIEDHLPGKRIAYFHTHGGADTSIVGYLAVEDYRDFDPFKDAYLAYVNRGYEQNLDIGWAIRRLGEDSVYTILLLPAGIYYRFNGLMEREGIVFGDYCWSIHNAGLWGEDTFLGYRQDVATWTVKYNMWKVWRRLRCSGYPRLEPTTDSAIVGTESLELAGLIPDNRLDCYRDCKNPITRFDDAGVFGNMVWWETGFETGSEGFRVRGYRSLDSEPEELVSVPARGGPGLRQRYWLEVPGGYERYDVVEWDNWGRTTVSHRIPRTEKPAGWEEWIAEPTSETGVMEPLGDPKPLVEMVGGEPIPVEARRSGGVPGTLDLPPSDALCADVVIYTSDQSLLWEVEAHLGREGLKYRSFLGTQHPEDARTAYSLVLQANEDYENACQSYPGGCDKTYPVSPGPLLIIVGNGQSVVYHMRVAADDGRCLDYEGGCRSDLDITDVDGDGMPEGPVTRIPADEPGDVYYACHGAEDFNHGRYVDEDLRLATIVGDCSQDDSSRCGGWPREFAGEVVSAYEAMGYEAHPTLLTSDYLPYFPIDSKIAACRNQTNAGVVELWGVDTHATDQARWPGLFFWGHDYDVSQLTKKQRYIAWLPSCKTVSTWYLTVPFAETFMFNNYPDRTVLVGAVGHLHGGWTHQHEDFARILLEERQNAEPGTPIARIAYDAVIRAQTERPHLFDYARSVGVVGSYVTLPDFFCQDGHKECEVTVPREGAALTKGLIGRIDWRMCLGEAEGERIRKHAIFESRDDGATWSGLVDSVEASARRYLWNVGGEASDLCRVKVVTEIEEYDSTGGDWVPAYICECISGLFSIVPGGGSYPDPCPHLFVWREGDFDLVNSVLRPDGGLRKPADDYMVLKDIQPDQEGLIRFRIDEIEPDTAYVYEAGLTVLPEAGEVMVTPDGGIMKVGDIQPPIAAILEGKDVLAEIARSDEAYLVGTEGTTITVTFPGLEATEATLVICTAKKDLPELPFGEGITSLTGMELRIVGSGGFLAGGDTTTSVILHPRQFPSETALALTGIDPTAGSLVVEVVWHSEHHLDAISISTKVDSYMGDEETLMPVRVKYIPKEDVGGGEGDWMVKLLPGDKLFLDFEPGHAAHSEDTAYLLSLTGYFVRPAGLAGIPRGQPVSMWLASGNPCTGPTLSGHLAIPSDAYVSLEVYDVRGRLVRRIMAGDMEAGVHPFEWDLRNDSKEPAAPGLYFLRFDTPKRTIATKVVVRK